VTAPSGFIESPFHDGEIAARRRAGVRSGSAAIRAVMPEQHRQFFAGLRYLLIAVLDPGGAPAAAMLFGQPGFVASPDPVTLRIDRLPSADDPVGGLLTKGVPIAVLGIDLATRRRNRANGTIAMAGAGGITVAVTQSFGNCPQYIQSRSLISPPIGQGAVTERLGGLDSAARQTIHAADTFFVASSSGARGGSAAGADISHRGGRPGFVRVDGNTLTVPDFHGNQYFNTLGNILLEPRVALLFPDFRTGGLLHVSGEATVEWESPEAAAFAGAERLWRVRVAHAWRRIGALPDDWAFDGYAPATERTGQWPDGRP
jgi:uncharacterized protein